MHSRIPSRQSGKHNESKEKRKSNRKHRKDMEEENNEILDTLRPNPLCPTDVRSRVPVSNPTPDNGDTPPAAHSTVEAARPVPPPNWHQKMQAFAPSRSYLTNKKDEEES